MKPEPLVSIIVPVYKAQDYLYRCVESILEQSYTKLEVILVDDGSPDKCPEICDNLTLMDTRIIVIHKEHGGLVSARNEGLKIMSGEYVSFVDSKDFIRKDMIKSLVAMCVKYHCGIAGCSLAHGRAGKFVYTSRRGKVRVYRKHGAFMSRKIKGGIAGKLFLVSLFDYERFPARENISLSDETLLYRLYYKTGRTAVTDTKMYYEYETQKPSVKDSCRERPSELMEFYEDRIHYFKNKEKDYLELSHEHYCICLSWLYVRCKREKCSKSEREAVLRAFIREYRRVMGNHITPAGSKLLLFVFYHAPDFCADFLNAIHVRPERYIFRYKSRL